MEFHVHGGPAVVSGVLQALGELSPVGIWGVLVVVVGGWDTQDPPCPGHGESPHRQCARAAACRGGRVHSQGLRPREARPDRGGGTGRSDPRGDRSAAAPGTATAGWRAGPAVPRLGGDTHQGRSPAAHSRRPTPGRPWPAWPPPSGQRPVPRAASGCIWVASEHPERPPVLPAPRRWRMWRPTSTLARMTTWRRMSSVKVPWGTGSRAG